MIGNMRPLVIRFPMIAAVILYTAQLTIRTGMARMLIDKNQRNRQENVIAFDMSEVKAAEQIGAYFTSSKGFLAGEDTPVWIAYRSNDDEPVSYRKLRKGMAISDYGNFANRNYRHVKRNLSESAGSFSDIFDSESCKKIQNIITSDYLDKLQANSRPKVLNENIVCLCSFSMLAQNIHNVKKPQIVKDAVDYWKAGKLDEIEISQADFLSNPLLPMYDSEEFVPKIVTEDTTERSDRDSEVLYLSILVTMDYEITWPTSEIDQQKLIMKKILYALSFWNGVDFQLRHLQNPKVRLRVTGIVIGHNREATPYLRQSSDFFGLSVDKSLPAMLKYWRKLQAKNKDFASSNFYNAVVAMTDATLSPGLLYTTAGIAMSGPPCVSSGTFIAGIVISDDGRFTGIQTAVHEMGHLLGEAGHDGDSSDCPEVTGYVHAPTVNNYGRIWSNCSLKHIATRLRQIGRRCMDKPKEYHPPGKPIGIILPGLFMRALELCRRRGWETGSVCWKDSTCHQLYCTNDNWFSDCNDSGPMLDGTTCGKGKMCLDGMCLRNTTFPFA